MRSIHRRTVLAIIGALALTDAMAGPGMNPFGPRKQKAPRGAVQGVACMSDGKKYVGMLHLTPGRRLRLFDAKNDEYVDYSLKQLKELKVNVTKSWIEKEWRFKEMGNDQKVYTGKSYARKNFNVTLTFLSGRVTTLEIARGMPIYCRPKDGKKRKQLLLQPYKNGEQGSTLADVVHIDRLVMGEEKPGKPSGAAKGGGAAAAKPAKPSAGAKTATEPAAKAP